MSVTSSDEWQHRLHEQALQRVLTYRSPDIHQVRVGGV
jgi:hypothetical protein